MNPQMETSLNLALALEGSAVPASDEIKRLAGVADMLEALPDPEIDPRFIARLEAVLMAEFDARQAPAAEVASGLRLVKPEAKQDVVEQPKTAPNVIQLPRRRFVVRKAIAGLAAAAMISALPVVAAASSLPGSPFFGIEKFRQNHAISSAHGVEKAFVMEGTARKWIGYGAEMVALDYTAGKIEGVLQHAGDLQSAAVALIAAHGSQAEVERFARMLRSDVTRLAQIRELAPTHAVPALSRAIDAANGLTDRLANAFNLTLPAQVGAAGSTVDGTVGGVESGNGTTGSTETTGGSAKSDPKDTGTKTDDQPFEDNIREVGDECTIIFSEQFGDLLTTPSTAVCKAGDATGDTSKN